MPATLGLGRSRLSLGRDLKLVNAENETVWLESTARLRPGQSVELVGAWPIPLSQSRARVVTWRLIRLSGEGPIYRGSVRLDR